MLYIFIFLTALFLAIPLIYYIFMSRISKRQWDILIEEPSIMPKISIIIPTFNEEYIIDYKLDNILLQDYPKDKMKIIIIDSCSVDGTVEHIKNFIEKNVYNNILLIEEEERKGKSHALNKALQFVDDEYVIISDVDCFLPRDIIKKSLPYLSDPRVAAVAAEEIIINPDDTSITRGEVIYRNKMKVIRLGESKLYSTIRFEGGYAIYKRRLLDKFDEHTGADDSGTAYNLIQKGLRVIVVPDLTFYTYFPTTFYARFTIKRRRANQLVSIWSKIVLSFLKNKSGIPKLIVIFNAFLYLINPIFFLLLFVLSIYMIIKIPLLILFSSLLIIPFIRLYAKEVIINHLILLVAVMDIFLGIKIKLWSSVEETRKIVNQNELKKIGLL